MLGATDSSHNVRLVMDRRFLWYKFYFSHFPFFLRCLSSVCSETCSFVCGGRAILHSLRKLQVKKISFVSYKNVRLGILLNSFSYQAKTSCEMYTQQFCLTNPAPSTHET